MKKNLRPIRTTLIFGLLCGVLYIPLSTGLAYLSGEAAGFSLPMGLYLALYSVCLARWAGKRLLSLFFPLSILCGAMFFMAPQSEFMLLALALFSWIRSAICFPKPRMAGIFAEGLLCLGAGLLVYLMVPQTPLGWALSIWLFFLIQALYFVLFKPFGLATVNAQGDSFEQSRMRAEKIVARL